MLLELFGSFNMGVFITE